MPATRTAVARTTLGWAGAAGFEGFVGIGAI
jgi:hypothetical protein